MEGTKSEKRKSESNELNNSRKIYIVLFGPPGSGKGTQSQYFCEKYDLIHISPGNYLRELRSKYKKNVNLEKDEEILAEYINSNWNITALYAIGMSLVKEKLQECVQQNKGFVMEGAPRSMNELKELKEMMDQLGLHFDIAFELKPKNQKILLERVTGISKQKMKQRNKIIGRRIHLSSGRVYHIKYNPPKKPETDDITGEPLSIREEDNEKTLKTRISSFNEHTLPVVNHFKELEKCFSIDAELPIEKITSTIENYINSKVKETSSTKKLKMEIVDEKMEDPNLEGISQKSQVLKATVIKHLLLKLIGSKKKYFPGTSPIGVSRDWIQRIHENDFLFSSKIDGIRYLLFIREGEIFLICRKMQVYKLQGEKLPSHLEKTVLDGELVKMNDGTISFIIFEAIQVGGKSVKSETLTNRMKAAASLVSELNISLKKTKLKVDVQIYHPISKIRLGFDKILKESKFPTDGIVIAKNNSPYILGFNDNIAKWKDKVDNTLDFQLKQQKLEDKIVHELHLQYSKGVGLYDYINQEDNPDFQFAELSGKILECYWDNSLKTEVPSESGWETRVGGWKVKKVREDKTRPNMDWVAMGIISLITNPVTAEELISLCESVK